MKKRATSTPRIKPLLAPLGSILVMLAGCSVDPKPFTLQEHMDRANGDLAAITHDNVALTTPLSRQEAIARGLMFNLDARQAMLEEALQSDQLSLANYSMLPHLAASAGYDSRNNFPAAESISLLSKQQSLEPSYSAEKNDLNANLTFTWNLLDFGLSYFQAKQQADHVMAAVEKRRRVMNNMVKDIEGAYWRAMMAQQLLPRIEQLERDINRALAASQRIEAQKLQPPVVTLQYRRSIMRTMMQIKQLHAGLAMAQSQLAQLIGLPPGAPIVLAYPVAEQQTLPAVHMPIENMLHYGLLNRAELREEAYQQRIDEQGVNKEMMKLFPGISALGSLNYDDNKLLAFNNWRDIGAHASWDLINLVQGPQAIKTAKTQVEVSKMRRLALTGTVMAQISISYNQYEQDVDSYNAAAQLANVEQSLLKVAGDARASSGTDFDYIQQSASTLAAQLECDRTFIEAKVAYANLLVSIGYDLVPVGVQTTNLNTMTSVVNQSLGRLDGNKMHGFIAMPLPAVAAANKS